MADNHQLPGGNNDDDIFVYVGGNAAQIPSDVRRARIDDSIDIISRDSYAWAVFLFLNGEQLIEVVGHDKLKKIEEYAFDKSRSLRRITKMGGVVEIEQGAFHNCDALSELDFDKVEIVGEKAFFNCKSLRSINLPSIKRIGESAFQGCVQLSDAVFGEDLEGIEGGAFHNCPALRRIAIPLKDGLIIEDDVFDWCGILSRVDVIGGIPKTVSSLHMESWRDEMKEEIDRINQTLPGTQSAAKGAAIQQWVESVHPKMEHYKAEHQIILKEAMTLLELALWKANLDDNEAGVPSQEGVRATRRQVKRARKERCITSGAGIIIKNVLPFLELK